MVMGLTAKSTSQVSPGPSDAASDAGVCFKMNSFLYLFVFLAETRQALNPCSSFGFVVVGTEQPPSLGAMVRSGGGGA